MVERDVMQAESSSALPYGASCEQYLQSPPMKALCAPLSETTCIKYRKKKGNAYASEKEIFCALYMIFVSGRVHVASQPTGHKKRLGRMEIM